MTDFGIEENIFYDEVMNKLLSIETALEGAKNGTENIEIINEIFRAFHTLKGVSDLLGFFNIVTLTHKAEDLLDEIRSKNIRFTSNIYYIFFELKKFISILVNDALQGIDMDSDKKVIFDSFISELKKYMPKVVLVMDQNTKIINYLNSIAQESEYKIITKENSNDALNIIKEGNVKIFVCDIQNSRQSSLQLIQDLKIQTEYKDIPIVISIEKEEHNLKELGKMTGAAAWIKKPFHKNNFHSIINNVLKNV
ncbi:MAG: Hpt domain-containing protein [Campylobacterota bacterium]|nr:Hpt domain-containing protein [Campylobacterota bacterium]